MVFDFSHDFIIIKKHACWLLLPKLVHFEGGLATIKYGVWYIYPKMCMCEMYS